MFLCSNVFQRIRANLTFHFILFFELMLGIMIMTIFISIDSSIHTKYTQLRELTESTLLKLKILDVVDPSAVQQSPENLNLNDNNEFPFSYDDYTYIKHHWKDELDISVVVHHTLNYLYQQNIQSLHVLYVSDEFFKMQLLKDGYEQFGTLNAAFVGEDTLQILEKGKRVDSSIFEFSVSNHKLHLDEEKSLKIIPAQKLYTDGHDSGKINIHFIAGMMKIDVRKAIILPVHFYYSENRFKSSDLPNTSISFQFKNELFSSKVSASVLQYVRKQHQDNGFTYVFDTYLSRYAKQTQQLQSISRAVNTLIIFSLITVGIGLSGLILTAINKRRKEIAISLAFGATLAQMMMEVVIEALTIIVLAFIAGVSIGVGLLNFMEFDEFQLIINFKMTSYIFVITLMIGLIAILPPVLKIRKIYPSRELQSL